MKRIAKFIGILLVGTLLLMGVAYFYASSGLVEMTDKVRNELNKEYVKLSEGSVHYGWAGPDTGEVVVFVHGFSTPRFVFEQNVEVLAAAGFRVLSFDHYGRGFSDRPKVDYDKGLYDKELLELLDALDIREPINLIGYSMGGGVVTVFAGLHPERVKRLVLIAPVGFLPEPDGIQKLLMVPGLGNWLMTVIGKKTLTEEFDKAVIKGEVAPSMAIQFKEQLEYKGVEHALLSSMHHYPMDSMKDEYITLGKSAMPKIMIWGTDDKTCPIDGAASIAELVPGITLKDVVGGGHGIPYSHTAEVNRHLLDFFGE